MRWIRPARLPILIAWMTILGAVAWFGTHPRLVAPFASRLISRELMHGTGGSIRVQDFRVRAFEGMDLYGVSLSLPGRNQGMTLVSADTIATPTGKVSVTVTLSASDGPLLSTVIV